MSNQEIQLHIEGINRQIGIMAKQIFALQRQVSHLQQLMSIPAKSPGMGYDAQTAFINAAQSAEAERYAAAASVYQPLSPSPGAVATQLNPDSAGRVIALLRLQAVEGAGEDLTFEGCRGVRPPSAG